MMRKGAYLSTIALFMVLALSGSAANSWAAERIYKMTGYITAIDRVFNTVVIEVPMVGKTFTVGGSLAPNVNLERGGHPAHLADYMVGDQVVVTWKHTVEGHLILSLTAK
jgi:hypothetical protein